MHSRVQITQKSTTDSSHPVFSDYSHLNNFGNVFFAVGLREEEGNNNIHRILPLTKIVPAKKAPKEERKKVVKKAVKEEEDAVCQRPDCTARRERLNDLKQENEHLRAQFKIIENKILASKTKKQLAEKTIASTEERNDVLRGQIDETQARIESIQAEISAGENANQKLRHRLRGLEHEIEVLKEQSEKDAEVMRNLQHRSVDEMVFANKARPRELDWEAVREVRGLRVDDDESDDD